MHLGSLVALVGSGCAHWQHAPGHGEQARMEKQAFRVVTGRLCHAGACDKRGPTGTLDFSNVWFASLNGARETTRFELAYQGTRARCQATTASPFACSIAEPGGARYELELGADCLEGAVRRAGHEAWWSLQTDRTTMAGHVFPAREVALTDDAGALVFASASGGGDNLDVFTRRGWQLPPAFLVAVAAVQAFLQLEDLPRECITPTA